MPFAKHSLLAYTRTTIYGLRPWKRQNKMNIISRKSVQLDHSQTPASCMLCCYNFLPTGNSPLSISCKADFSGSAHQTPGISPGFSTLVLIHSLGELESSSWRWSLSSDSSELFSPLKVLTMSIKISALNLSPVIKSAATFLITIWCLI